MYNLNTKIFAMTVVCAQAPAAKRKRVLSFFLTMRTRRPVSQSFAWLGYGQTQLSCCPFGRVSVHCAAAPQILPFAICSRFRTRDFIATTRLTARANQYEKYEIMKNLWNALGYLVQNFCGLIRLHPPGSICCHILPIRRAFGSCSFCVSWPSLIWGHEVRNLRKKNPKIAVKPCHITLFVVASPVAVQLGNLSKALLPGFLWLAFWIWMMVARFLRVSNWNCESGISRKRRKGADSLGTHSLSQMLLHVRVAARQGWWYPFLKIDDLWVMLILLPPSIPPTTQGNGQGQWGVASKSCAQTKILSDATSVPIVVDIPFPVCWTQCWDAK